MTVQYRVVKNEYGYFPQVRVRGIVFWSKWKKIAKHNTGFGLYMLPDWNYPETYADCEKIISEYHVWANAVTSTIYFPKN